MNYKLIRRWFSGILTVVIMLLSVVVPFLVIYEFGFPTDAATDHTLHRIYNNILVWLWLSITLRWIAGGSKEVAKGQRVIWRTLFYIFFSIVALLIMSMEYNILQHDNFIELFTNRWSVIVILLLISALELSIAVTSVLGRRTNPAAILAFSFAFIIIIGSLLLMLPNASHGGLRYIDALFVSTSAVCVTGLTPIDCSAVLTTTGYVILLMLIQIGGLGIMTITSFFGLFFMGNSSFAGQVVVGNLLNSGQIGSLIRVLLKIILVTLVVEAAGALCIYISVVDGTNMSHPRALFFAIFHAVSAFCNAGFSTLHGNLYDPIIRDVQGVMWVVSWLIIFGGIGFPIFSNFLTIIGHKISNVFRRIVGLRRIVRPRLWSLNSYIVVRTTAILIVVSYSLMLALEWNHSLAGYDISGKLAQGFLMAITPRTAGFNGVDLSSMLPATMFITMILMWIGGAPQSTAGGIKVTTLYLAVRNIFSAERIQANAREIPSASVRRALGVIMASMSIITLSVIILSLLEPRVGLIKLIFEVISAISTVGLSIGVTPFLGDVSKVLIITLMYIGRIGIIGLFALFINRYRKPQPYSYPQENILIN